MVVEPRALQLFAAASEAMVALRGTIADSLFAEAGQAQSGPYGPFHASVLENRALLARDRGDYEFADRCNQMSLKLDPAAADAWALDADLALRRGDRGQAVASVRQCLSLKPGSSGRIATGGQAVGVTLSRGVSIFSEPPENTRGPGRTADQGLGVRKRTYLLPPSGNVTPPRIEMY
jgi:tetratricopeptide (TPR) repeat protein